MNNLHLQKAQHKESHAKGIRQLKLLNQGKKQTGMEKVDDITSSGFLER